MNHGNIKVGVDGAKPTASAGDIYFATDTNKQYQHDGTDWREIGQSIGTVTLAGTVVAGDLIGYSSGWKQAANTAGSIIAAQFVACEGGDSGDVIGVARRWLVSGSYTAGNQVYLSTAGATTTTRPTTAASLRQRVGVALSTTQALVELRGLREEDVSIRLMGATSALAALDSGNFAAPTLDAQNEVAYLTAILPENFVSVAAAKLYIAAEATAGTPTMDITIGSAVTGEQHDAVTADSTLANAVREGSAADEIFALDISTGLDATNIARPGAIIGIKCLQDDAGTDISMVFGGTITVLVAE